MPKIMRKSIITILISTIILIVALVGVKVFLFPGNKESADNDVQPSVEDTAGVREKAEGGQGESKGNADFSIANSPDVENPIRTYDNGMATLTYDSTKLYFDETPPDNENGYPMASFMPLSWDAEGKPIYASEALPRVDAMPLEVSDTGEGTENFYNITEGDWEALARALVLGYYTSTEQDNVVITLGNPIVKVDGTSAKLFISAKSTLVGGLSMSGAIRMVADGTKAMVTLALTEPGATLPEEMKEAYMSVAIHD